MRRQSSRLTLSEEAPRITTRTSVSASKFYGLSARAYRHLRRAQVPVLRWQILFYLSQKQPGISDPDLSCVDYYAGMGRIKRTFEEHGLSA